MHIHTRMRTCIHMLMGAHIYTLHTSTLIHTHICTHIHMYTHKYVFIYTCTHIYSHVHIYIHVHTPCTQVHKSTQSHTRILTYKHVSHTCICVIINWELAGTHLTAVGPTVAIALSFCLGFVAVFPFVVVCNSDILCRSANCAPVTLLDVMLRECN